MDDRPVLEALLPLILDIAVANAHVIAIVTTILLVVLALGVYIRFTAYLCSVFVCYLGIIHYTADTRWPTQMFFVASLLLLLFAMYAEQDHLSVDGLRIYSTEGSKMLDNHLKSTKSFLFHATPLAIFLVALGLIYFGSGIGKLAEGGPGWISATNLGRHMHHPIFVGYLPQLTDILIEYSFLLTFGAFLVILFEVGLLPITFITSGRVFSATIAALLGFHVSVALLMGPVFVYTIVSLLLFFDWQRLVSRIASHSKKQVIYDRKNRSTLWLLYYFKHLDANNTLLFSSSVDSNVLQTTIDDDRPLAVVHGDTIYKGYDAICELCRHVGVCYPIYLLLSFSPTERIIKRLYSLGF